MIIIKYNNNIIQYENNKHILSILSIIRKKFKHHHYQCCNGICGTCKCKIIQGKHLIYYIKNPLGFIKENEILPCISFMNPNSFIELETSY